MQMTIHDFKDILELMICVMGVVIPLVMLIKEHYAKKKHRLAEQVIAYYCLQEEAIKWIKELNPNEKKVKEQLRQRAEASDLNFLNVYPNMAIKEASDYL